MPGSHRFVAPQPQRLDDHHRQLPLLGGNRLDELVVASELEGTVENASSPRCRRSPAGCAVVSARGRRRRIAQSGCARTPAQPRHARRAARRTAVHPTESTTVLGRRDSSARRSAVRTMSAVWRGSRRGVLRSPAPAKACSPSAAAAPGFLCSGPCAAVRR